MFPAPRRAPLTSNTSNYLLPTLVVRGGWLSPFGSYYYLGDDDDDHAAMGT